MAWRQSGSCFESVQQYCSMILVCVVLCIAGGLYIHWKQTENRKKGPPGPKGLPFIGHLHLLGLHPHKSLFHLSKLHGPLMWLRFGSVPVIVASSPHAARLILQTHDQVFAGRPRSVAAVSILYNCKDIVFSPPNPYWKLLRQICVTDLLSSKRLEGSKPIRELEARRLVGSIMKEILQANPALSRAAMDVADVKPGCETSTTHANTGGPEASFMQEVTKGEMICSAAMPIMVSVRAKLLQASNNMISRMVFGRPLSEIISSRMNDDPSLNLLHLLDELLQCLSVFNLSDLIPSIAWMDLQGVRRRSRALARKLDPVLQEIVDLWRQKEHSRNTSSLGKEELMMLDVLLSLSTKNAEIKDDNIKAFILNMFVGGTDTSANTVEWALAELVENPWEMKVVQEEIDKVVGRERAVHESDLAHLPYLRAVVSETMRLHPILPLLVAHEATQRCTLLGFDVPENTQAYVNAWAVGRDADAWEEPLLFKPQRFLKRSHVSIGGQSFELLVFGEGRRKCPGWALGLRSVQLQLASLLQGFDWFAPPKFDLEEKFGVMTVKAEPLAALAAPKLLPHLYFDATQA